MYQAVEFKIGATMRRAVLLWALTLSAVLLTQALDSSGEEVVLLHDGVQEDICGDGKKSGGEQCDDVSGQCAFSVGG
jgi:hypothetical protein